LFNLHVLAKRRVPSRIIKYRYFPGFLVQAVQVGPSSPPLINVPL
jgi:hypothetical protein